MEANPDEMKKFKCICGYEKKEDELVSVFLKNHKEHMETYILLWKGIFSKEMFLEDLYNEQT